MKNEREKKRNKKGGKDKANASRDGQIFFPKFHSEDGY